MAKRGIEDGGPSLALWNLIVATIREVALLSPDVEILGSDDLSSLATDSIVMIDIILHLEQRLGIELDDEDLTEDNFSTVEALFELVARYARPLEHQA